MDCRLTLGKNDSFLHLLQQAQASGEKLYLLLDKNGITRAEGFVKAIQPGPLPVLELDNGLTTPINKIIAINGIFSPEYGEC